jgi:2-C-methyl-D-erythritol 2,4-cyclodiphosphate synthase
MAVSFGWAEYQYRIPKGHWAIVMPTCLLHAICDAMLGAACLGDIGVHFPDTEPSLKNIDSKVLLR